MSADTPLHSVIVTGAANGIGKACTQNLLQKQHRILAVDLEMDILQKAHRQEHPNLVLSPADISIPEDCSRVVARAVKQFGRIDALIHWAGVHSTKTWDTRSQCFRRISDGTSCC